MLMLLPTFIRLGHDAGEFAAKGLLAAQLAAVFATYSFPVVVPRSLLNQSEDDGLRILKGVFYYQAIFFLLAGICLSVVVSRDYFGLGCAVTGLLVGYSSVLQWQWYHIGKQALLPALLLMCSRVILLLMEFVVMFISGPIVGTPFIIILLVAIIVLVPIWPTWRVICKRGLGVGRVATVSGIGKLLRNEFHRGKNLFLASLLSSVYTLGPATLVAVLQPTGLVGIQQFDRLRSSVSNLTGMLLSTIYPLLLKLDRTALDKRFTLTQRLVVRPAFLISSLLLLIASLLPEGAAGVLKSLNLSWTALSIAVACAVAASASNTIAMTFLHMFANDRIYRLVIFAGAILFTLTVFVFAVFEFAQMPVAVMVGAAFAELLVLAGLWCGAYLVRRNDVAL